MRLLEGLSERSGMTEAVEKDGFYSFKIFSGGGPKWQHDQNSQNYILRSQISANVLRSWRKKSVCRCLNTEKAKSCSMIMAAMFLSSVDIAFAG